MRTTSSSFDQLVDYTGDLALAQDHNAAGKDPALIPLWLGDMGFAPPSGVSQAINEQAKRGFLGYATRVESVLEAVGRWMRTRHNWEIDPGTIVQTPGVVPALYLAVAALTEPGDGVLVMTPAYPPFFGAVRHNSRRLITSSLVNDQGRYRLDGDDIETKAKNAKLLILCSPHNPTGRVWERGELEFLAEVALKYNLSVVSDEIHHDFVYPGHDHVPFASLADDVAAITVTCTAPSKTFNLAGLQIANIIIESPDLRRAFSTAYYQKGFSQPPILGLVACQAAYDDGATWVDQMVTRLDQTMSKLVDLAAKHLPRLRYTKSEGTYMAWLDFRGLGLDQMSLLNWAEGKARLWLGNGTDFGPDSTGYLRMTTAFPHQITDQAITQLDAALAAGT